MVLVSLAVAESEGMEVEAKSVIVPPPLGLVATWKKLEKDPPVEAPPILEMVEDKRVETLAEAELGRATPAVRSGKEKPSAPIFHGTIRVFPLISVEKEKLLSSDRLAPAPMATVSAPAKWKSFPVLSTKVTTVDFLELVPGAVVSSDILLLELGLGVQKVDVQQ